MADQVVREFTIRVNAKGQIEAIKGFEKLDDSIEKTNASMGENDRKQKAVAQATSNSTKAFAKQAQGLGGVVRIYATVAANVFALSSAFNVLKRNADLTILQTASRQLSINTGQNYAAVANSLKEITGGALSFRDAMQSANLALAGGFSGAQANKIAEIATKSANALGRSVPEAVQRLTQAIVKGEPELADEFGIILRVTEATKDYAQALGKLPEDLTTAQRTQAVYNQFLEQGEKKTKGIEAQVNQYDKLAASFGEFTNKVLAIINVPLEKFIGLLADSGVALAGVFLGIAGGIGKLLVPELKNLGDRLLQVSKATAKVRFDNFTKKATAAKNATEALAAGVYDYTEILRSSAKNADLSKVNFGKGINSQQLVQELFDPGSFGEQIRDEITRNVFNKDFGKQKGVINNYIKGLNSAIQKAVDSGARTVNFRGLKASITEATSFVDLLKVSISSNERTAIASGDKVVTSWNRVTGSIKRATSAVSEFSSGIKSATGTGYAQGLEQGFKSFAPKNILNSFTELKAQVGGGKIQGNIAGIFGVGAKLAGGFLTAVTKVASAFGVWGFAIAAIVSVLNPLARAIGLTSEAGDNAAKSLKTLADNAGVASETVKELKDVSKGSFEAQAEAAQILSNLLKGYISDLKLVNTAFRQIQEDLDNAKWSEWFGNEEEFEQASTSLLVGFNSITQGIEKSNKQLAENMRRDLFSKKLNLNEIYQLDPKNASMKGQELTQSIADGILKEWGTQYGRYVEVTPTGVNLLFGLALKEGATDALGQLINEVAQNTPLGGKVAGERITAAVENTISQPQEKFEQIAQVPKALEEVGRAIDDVAVKVQGSTPIYTTATRALDILTESMKGAGGVSASAEVETNRYSTTLINLAEDALGKSIKNVGDFREGLVALQAEEDRNITAVSNLKSKTTAYKAALVSISDEVKRGSIGKMTEQFQYQKAIKENQIKLLDEEIRKQKQLKISAGQSEQAAPIRRAAENEINRLLSEQDSIRNTISTTLSQEVLANEQLKLVVQDQLKIENLKLSALNDQKSLLSAISSATGSSSDKQLLLDFEKNITAQKIAQLNAAIASKKAEADRLSGSKAQVILTEITNLEKKKQLELDIANIKQITGQRDINLADLERQNKLQQQILDTQTKGLEVQKGLADIRAGDKFLSTAQNDAAKLLSLSKDLELTAVKKAKADQKVESLTNKLLEETNALNQLDSKSVDYKETSERLQAAKLALIQAENEARGLTVEKEAAILKFKEEQFEIDKKNADLFKDPQKFQELLGEQFRRAAKDFGEAMGSSINRIVDITLGTIDAGIDAFVDAVRNGEDALEAAKTAIKDTFLELNANFIKDQFKLLARNAIATITGNKNFGKSEELVEAETQTSWLQRIWEAIKNPTGSVPGGTAKPQQQQQQSMFDNITKFFKDTFAKVKDVFSNVGQSISTTVTDAFTGISDFISGIDLSGMFDTITSALSSFGSSIGGGGMAGGGGGIGDLISTGISLLFAKNGGIVNELSKRVPAYANGTITQGPELAMIGEGEKKEAVVPLPDNRSIPVTIEGSPEGNKEVNNSFNISITGVQGDEQGIRRSANQLALQIAREQSRAQGRIG